MNSRPITVLQMNPFMDFLEQELANRYEVIRWFELSTQQQQAWLNERAADVQAVATGVHVGCSVELMEALPALKVVSVNGVGADKVDAKYAASRNIAIGTTVGGPTECTADLAVGLVIALLREIPAAHEHVRDGKWTQAERPLARKVTGRRFGIVGLGQIGSAIAARLAPFGPVSYNCPTSKDVPYEYVADLHDLARQSDLLIVACPANAATHHLIDAGVFESLGAQSWLVNIARGAVVDEEAMIAALEAGQIAGAGIDVFEDEPNVPEALRTHPNVVLVPHMGSATVETRTRMAEILLENIEAAIAPR